ncbi:MAG TPA: hypothetical protein VGD37_02960 [Kofleriaceae bacterium]|jgi:hypothetical protein
MSRIDMWCLVTVMVGLGACGEGMTADAAPPETEPPAVLVRTDAASPADCAHGGSVVTSGLDDNRNGQLDDGEIRTRTVLCRDLPPSVVVRLVAEPPGLHCAQGGTAVLSGADDNGNGQLDDAEVAHVDYACGEALLTRFVAEPPGTNCVAGGVVFFVGRDRNGDGQLGNDEIEQTKYQCGDIVSGDITIASAQDVAALASIRVIEGTLRVVNASVGELSLPALQHVGLGVLISQNTALQRVSLPRLLDVEWFVSITDNASLTAVDLTGLTRVGTSLDISGNPALLDLTKLTLSSVGGRLSLRDNRSLPAATIGGTLGGSLEVTNNAALATLDLFPQAAGQVHVANNGIQKLTIATAALGDVSIRDNAALSTLIILTHRLATLVVTGNTALTTLDMANTVITGDVTVSSPQLGGLYLDSSHLQGSLSVSGPVSFMGFHIIVDGDLTLDGTRFTGFVPEQPFLSVGGTLRLSHNDALDGAWFQTPGGGIELIENAVLGGVIFGGWPLGSPQSDVLHGDVIVSGNPNLRMNQFLFNIRRIEGSLRVVDNPQFRNTASAGLREVAGEIEVRNNPLLERAGFDQLQSVAGRITVAQNATLPIVEFPLLSATDWGIEISSNPELQHVSAAVLQSASMTVVNNPVLPACEVAALFGRLGRGSQSGNDENATCP